MTFRVSVVPFVSLNLMSTTRDDFSTTGHSDIRDHLVPFLNFNLSNTTKDRDLPTFHPDKNVFVVHFVNLNLVETTKVNVHPTSLSYNRLNPLDTIRDVVQITTHSDTRDYELLCVNFVLYKMNRDKTLPTSYSDTRDRMVLLLSFNLVNMTNDGVLITRHFSGRDHVVHSNNSHVDLTEDRILTTGNVHTVDLMIPFLTSNKTFVHTTRHLLLTGSFGNIDRVISLVRLNLVTSVRHRVLPIDYSDTRDQVVLFLSFNLIDMITDNVLITGHSSDGDHMTHPTNINLVDWSTDEVLTTGNSHVTD